MDFKTCNSNTILQFHGPYRRQSFSLPDSIIYYITKNPTTPKVYQKLIKSCKYFFTKNPIIIFDSLSQFIYLGGGGVLYDKNLSKRIKFDINKISIKIWIYTIFQISSENSKFFSSLIPIIYRCDASHIYLNKQDILLDDFIFFTKPIQYFTARDSKILKSNGTEAFMEEIVEVLPNLKEFQL